MGAESRYYRRARISEAKVLELLSYFVRDLSATDVAAQTGLTRKTVTSIFLKLRRRIARELHRTSPFTFQGTRENGFSCTTCLCGRCSYTVSRSTPLFALLIREGKIFTFSLPECRKPILRALIRGRVISGAGATNGWHGYDALIDAGYPTPLVLHGDRVRISQINAFWGYTLARLQKFNGVPNRTFYLHLKESEWRFNHRNQKMLELLLELLETEQI